jgi:hypothetical protein
MGPDAWPGGIDGDATAGGRGTGGDAAGGDRPDTFLAWDDPDVGDSGVPVDGPYARTAWLPVLGASSWQVWTAVVDQLAGTPEARCEWPDLAPPGAESADVVGHGLQRLVAFRLADRDAAGRWLVRTTCPPLWGRMLARAPSPVHAIHAVTFRHPQEDDPGPEVACVGATGAWPT